MRNFADSFTTRLGERAQQPRHVIEVEFTTGVVVAITSHADIVWSASTVIDGGLRKVSSLSQRLDPDAARATIGTLSFEVVDLSDEFTTALQAQLASGRGLRGKTVRYYKGFVGFQQAAFELMQTQQAQSATENKGLYRVTCTDIQRELRKEIFDPAETTISSSVGINDTTINVGDTSGFELVAHGTSYTDAPSATVGYIKIGDEVIRYTGKTATSFTGCTRGVFGTTAEAYTVGAESAERREKVEEFIYLELPAGKLLYAVLTGDIHGTANTLPATWHLGIDPSDIDLDSLLNIGPDLWDTTNDANGLVLRFAGLVRESGKQWLEQEVLRLSACFMPVLADGRLRLRRVANIGPGGGYVAQLDESNIVSYGALKHDMDAVRNQFRLNWNYNGERYTRAAFVVDAGSINEHGESPVKEISFKGLHGSRHTASVVTQTIDALRDRFAGPPEKLTIETLGRMAGLEVGDTIRVTLANVRDFSQPAGSVRIDRVFEIQQMSTDWNTGRVRIDLFGSTRNASVDEQTGLNTVLDDLFYTAAGSPMTSFLTIDGAGNLTADGTLTGGSTTSSAIFYYLGDLTIPSGRTLTTTGNVQLRVRGTLTVNGTIRCTGGLPAANNGTAGFVGAAQGGNGIVREYSAAGQTIGGWIVRGEVTTLPIFSVVNETLSIAGLPSDLRGCGGPRGARATYEYLTGPVSDPTVAEYTQLGAVGGAGGGGLVVVSRGMAFGVSGVVNTSGANGGAPVLFANDPELRPQQNTDLYTGGGGGGGPGGLLVLLDGTLATLPDVPGNFIAKTGLTPQSAGYHLPTRTVPNLDSVENANGPVAGQYTPAGEGLNQADFSGGLYRVQYLTADLTPEEDVLGTIAETNTILNGSGAPSDSLGANGDYYIDNDGPDIWGPKSGGTWVGTGPTPLGSTGPQGPEGPGVNVVFRRSATQPATPNASSGTPTTPAVWYATVDDANAAQGTTNPLWQSTGTRPDSLSNWNWQAPVLVEGQDGDPGLSVAHVVAYRRGASAPGTPTNGSYDFTTKVLTPPTSPAQWYASISACNAAQGTTDPLYIVESTASVQGTTGSDGPLSWSPPVLFVVDGTDGEDGQEVDIVFRRSAILSPPAKPTGATNPPTTPAVWYATVAAADAAQGTTDPLWSSVGKRTPPSTLWTWNDPTLVEGQEGPQGPSGQSVAELVIYRRSPSTPTPNPPTGGEYDFDTKTLNNPPTGWTSTLPAGSDPLYASRAVAFITGTSGTDPSLTWSSAAKILEDGAPGDAVDIVFVRSATRPATPTASPGTPTAPITWYTDVDSVPASANPLWSSTGFKASGQTNFTWQPPVLVSNIYGEVTSNIGFTWTRAPNDGAYTPSGNATLTCKFYQEGVEIASRTLTVTFTSGSGTISASANTSGGITTTRVGSTTPAMTVTFTHDATGASVSCALQVVQGGSQGPTGPDGWAYREVFVYLRSASAPGTPTTGGQYNFDTGALTAPTAPVTWYNSVAAANAAGGTTNPLWVSTSVAAAQGATGTDTTLTWSTPAQLAENGEDGQEVDLVFVRSASQPATPTGTTNPPTTPITWYATVESVPAGGNPIWASVGTRTPPSTTWAWQAPIRQEGIDGDTGPQGPTGPGGADGYPKNFTPASDFTGPADPASSPMGGWSRISGVSGSNSTRNDIDGPVNTGRPLVLQVRGNGSTLNWHGLWAYDLTPDLSKPLVTYVWVRRRSSNTDRGLYLGWEGGTGRLRNVSGGGESTNPYFVQDQASVMTVGKWYLAIGIIHPQGYAGSGLGLSGLYDPENGEKVYGGGEFFHHESAPGDQYLRIGFFSSSTLMTSADGFQFLPAGTYVVDGSEPKKLAVLGLLTKADVVADFFKAFVATIDTLQTREPGTGSLPPRVVISNSYEPIRVENPATGLPWFSLSNVTGKGLRLEFEGEFSANMLDSAAFFTDAGISDLRGRLGLLEPSGGGEQTGGTITTATNPTNVGGTTLNTDYYVACTGSILSGGNLTTLTARLTDSYQEGPLASQPSEYTPPSYQMQFEWSNNGSTWSTTGMPAAETVTGYAQRWKEDAAPFVGWWRSYGITATITKQFTPSTGAKYYRVRVRRTAGLGSVPKISNFTASEGIQNGGVIESHTHAIADVTGLQTALDGKLSLGGGTLTGPLLLPASVAGGAPINLGEGTAPTTPVDGDLWFTTTAFQARINGTTRTIAHTSQWSAMSVSEGTTGTATTSRLMRADYLKQIVDTLADARIAANPPSLTWGSITGTLSSQTDLQSALNGKLGNSTGAWINDAQGNPRLYFSASGDVNNGVILRGSNAAHHFQFRNSANTVVWQVGHDGTLETGSVPWARVTSAPSFLTANQTITLSGDASGSGTTSIAVTVADDSHNHVISNIDNLQSTLDGKAGLEVGVALKHGSFTIGTAERNSLIYKTNSTVYNYTLPASGTVAVGFQVRIDNAGTTALNIVATTNSQTLKWQNGTSGQTGTRVLAAGGSATLTYISTGVWHVVGVGLS